jgi:hypothetical protein
MRSKLAGLDGIRGPAPQFVVLHHRGLLFTRNQAGERIGAKGDHISRMELGQTRVRVAEVVKLLEFDGDDPQHIQAMAGLAGGANRRTLGGPPGGVPGLVPDVRRP